MAIENKTQEATATPAAAPQKDDKELLKAIAGVLDEALAEYEKLAKNYDIQMAEDPSRPFPPADAAPAKDEDADEEDEDEDKDQDGEEDEEDEKPMDDDAMKSEFAKISAEMEKRGLLKKSEPAKTEEKMTKSETKIETPAAPAAEDKSEALKKSFDEQFSTLAKAVESLKETVEKIAAQPAPRKGLSGLAPLRKSEGEQEQTLNKSDTVEKLLDLRKGGDRRIDTSLITRIETDRMTSADAALVKSILA